MLAIRLQACWWRQRTKRQLPLSTETAEEVERAKKEQTQRRRKGVVKGRGFDGGKKFVFVAKPEIYGKRLISLHLSEGRGQVNSRHLMQNKAVTC